MISTLAISKKNISHLTSYYQLRYVLLFVGLIDATTNTQ